MSRRLLITPVCDHGRRRSPASSSPSASYWEDVDQGELGTVRYPGAFAKFSARRCEALPPAPRSGPTPTRCWARPDPQPARGGVRADALHRPTAGGREGARLHVGHGRAGRGPGADRLRGRGRPGRVGQQDRRGPHAAALPGRHPRPRELGAVEQHERRQVGPRPRHVPPRRHRRGAGTSIDWADIVLESFSPGPWPPGASTTSRSAAATRHHHGVELPDGPDRPVGHAGRLRDDGRRHLRLLLPGGLARPGAVRAVRRLHRLHLAPLAGGRR